MFNVFKKNKFYAGCFPDILDLRDKKYDEVAAVGKPIDWDKGYDIEKILDIKIPFKNQDGSSSCVGNGFSYYVAVLNTVETGFYKDVSAKAFYSQIYLSGGGAYLRDAAKLAVNWGSLSEFAVSSYQDGKPPSEEFMRDLSWKNEKTDKMAKVLQAKEYRVIDACDNIDLFAMAIRDNYGVAGGVYIGNNNSWRTNEPIPSTRDGGHCIFYGKFGIDEKGKYIATPNSWGEREKDDLHTDGWQKLRESYFNSLFQFNPWTLIDKPNIMQLSAGAEKVILNNEKKIVIEGEATGRKGIIINGVLKEIKNDREAAACLYALANNKLGITVSKALFDELNQQNYIF